MREVWTWIWRRLVYRCPRHGCKLLAVTKYTWYCPCCEQEYRDFDAHWEGTCSE